jgi:endonuclease V-like protein UPF0215 family
MAKEARKNEVKFYQIKDEVRILGLDDAPFEFKSGSKAMIVGVVMRGGSWVDGIMRSEVEVDGIDSTDVVAEMVGKSKFKDVRVIMLDGLGFAGFNLVDLEELFKKTNLPVIAVVRKMPDYEGIEAAIKNLPHKGYYQKCIKIAGKPRKVETKPGKHIYIQYRGISFENAKKIVQLASTRSNIPEPLRLAHIIASGIALGESRGGA